METQNKQGGNVAAIITMFALFFMIAFVTNFASPMGVIAKNQFNASNAPISSWAFRAGSS